MRGGRSGFVRAGSSVRARGIGTPRRERRTGRIGGSERRRRPSPCIAARHPSSCPWTELAVALESIEHGTCVDVVLEVAKGVYDIGIEILANRETKVLSVTHLGNRGSTYSPSSLPTSRMIALNSVDGANS